MSGKGEARYRITLDIGQFESAVDKVKKQFEDFGSTLAKAFGVGGAFALGEKAAEALAESIKAVPAAVVGAVEHLAEFGHEMEIASLKTGLSVDALQKLGVGARLTGSSLESVTSAVGKMEASIGTGNKAFEAMGLSVSKLKAMKPEEAFATITERIREMATVDEQAAAAKAVFGKAWQDLAGIIKDPSVLDAASRLGAQLGDADVKASAELARAGKEMSIAWEAVQNQFAAAIVSSPELRAALEGIVSALAGVATWARENRGGIAAVFEMMVGFATSAVTGFRQLYDWAGKAAEKLKFFIDAIPGLRDAVDVLERLHTHLQLKNLEGSGLSASAHLVEGGHFHFDPNAEAEAAKQKRLLDEIDAKMVRARHSYEALEREIFNSTKAGVDATNKFWEAQERAAASYGQKLLASLTATHRMQLEGDRVIDEAQKAYFAAIERGLPSLAHQKDLIDVNTQAHINQIECLVREGKMFEDDGNLAIGMYRKAGEAEKKYAQQKDLERKLGDIADIGAALAELFQSLGAKADSSLVTIANAASAGAASAQKFHQAWLEGDVWGKIQAGIQLATESINNFMRATDSASGGARGLGGAMAGAGLGSAIGGLAGPTGAMIGAAVGAVAGAIAGIFRQPSWIAVGQEAGKVLGMAVSKELAKAIEQTSKTLHISVESASLLHLSDAMNETHNSAISAMDQIYKLMDGVATKTIPAKEGVVEIGKAFTLMAQEAAAGSAEAAKDLVVMIQKARAEGMKIPEIQAAVKKGLDDAMSGVADMTANMPIVSPAVAEAEGYIFASVFWAKVKEEGIVAAATAMKPAYDAFVQAMESAHIDPAVVGAIVGPIASVMDLLSDKSLGPMIKGLDGATRAVKGLGDAGYMTKGAFAGLGTVAQSTYDQILAKTGDSNQAMQAILPTLAEIENEHERYGLAIDENTQKLIDQAKANGVAFPTDPLLKVVELLEKIAEKLGAISGAHDIDLNVNTTYHGTPPPPEGGETGQASGGTAWATPGGVLTRLGEGNENEDVVPWSKRGAYARSHGGNDNAGLMAELAAMREQQRTFNQMLPKLIRDAVLLGRV